MTVVANKAISKLIDAGGLRTNYIDHGAGFPILLLHGSGVGVTAYANWRSTIPEIGKRMRALAIDVAGFGYTECPPDTEFNLEFWVKHVVAFLDAMRIEKAHLVGNSFGGALALAVAARHPARVDRMVLMGSAGTMFTPPPGFSAGSKVQEPSLAQTRTLMEVMTYDPALITDELVQLRHETSARPGYQETSRKLFPGSREEKMRALVTPPEILKSLPHRTLVVHGREDRVIPVESSLAIHNYIARSELHVFGHCGHWVHIDQPARFINLVDGFLDDP